MPRPREQGSATPSDLVSQLQWAHNRRRDHKGRADVALNVLRAAERGRVDPRIHTVVSFQPMEDLDRQSSNYTLSIVFPERSGKLGFIQTQRSRLSAREQQQRVDELALDRGDVREETLVERQKRLVIEILWADKQMSDLDSADATTEMKRDQLQRTKYKKALSYLRASLLLEKAHPHLDYLFSTEDQGDRVALVMGQPRERNIVERLLDESVETRLEDATNDHTTFLDRTDLIARKARVDGGSEDELDMVAAEICDILQVNPTQK